MGGGDVCKLSSVLRRPGIKNSWELAKSKRGRKELQFYVKKASFFFRKDSWES